MKKTKYYHNAKFEADVIRKADDLFQSFIPVDKKGSASFQAGSRSVTWDFDSREEFFAEYLDSNQFRVSHRFGSFGLSVYSAGYKNTVGVEVELSTRDRIEAIFNIFEQNVNASRIITVAAPVKVFIGHGRDNQWRELKDHLQDLHGIEVEAYEVGPRAGQSIKDVLESMLDHSSFALIVLTGEDEHTDGTLHARENVIHELGLFQGRIGFKRAIAVLEEGVKEFSNVLGLNQIRFSAGNIRSTFGDILATLKRELE